MKNFSQYTDEGMRIVDKRGLPYESLEERNEAYFSWKFLDWILDEIMEWDLSTEDVKILRKEAIEDPYSFYTKYLKVETYKRIPNGDWVAYT